MKKKAVKSKYASQKFLLVIGRNLYSLRIGQRKDLNTVAAALEITPQLLERIENGDYDCDLSLFMDLCSYYNVKPATVVPA